MSYNLRYNVYIFGGKRSMLLYIIVLIIVLILIGIGIMFYLRNNKRIVIEDVEKRKENIEALPFQNELVKVKDLNLKGEAKMRFEQWKREWQTVLNEDIKNADHTISDADELLDKFKFSDSTEKVNETHQILDQIEKKYNHFSSDINQYVDRANDDQVKFDQCKTIYREAKRDVLANRHQFGESAQPLERLIESYIPKYDEYNQLVEEGNYDSAHHLMTSLHNDMTQLKKDMDEIPVLIREVQKELPGQFQDIKFGCRDLKVEGYNLDHVKVDSTLQTLKGHLNLVEPHIARLELDEAKSIIDRINDSIDEMLELIEIEVLAKNNVEKSKEFITEELFYAKDMNYTLRTEIDYVKENYHINEEDIQDVRQYDNEIQSLIAVYDDILTETAKSAVRYSEVEDNLKYIKEHVEVINNNQEQIQKYLTSLREYEREAKDHVLKIQSRKEVVYRRLLAANLSSIPERFIILKNEIDIETREVHSLFNKRPMNVEFVRNKVNKVLVMMNKFEEEADEMIQNAKFAELLIQYGNRYRKDYSDVNRDLNEAERLFNNNRYKRAVEIAEQAINRVEPGASAILEQRVRQSNN